MILSKKQFTAIGGGLALLLTCSVANAQQTGFSNAEVQSAKLGMLPADDGFHFTLGGAGIAANSIYDNEADYGFIPIINASWNGFFIGSGGIGYDFSRLMGNGDLSLITRIAYDKADFPDGSRFDGLSRKGFVTGNIDAEYNVGDMFDVGASLSTDLSNRNDGWETTLTVGKTLPVGNFIVQGKIGATYESGKLSQYRYGVSENEANANRAAYNAEGNWSPVAEITAMYPINDNSVITGGLSYKRLSADIKESPLVDTGHETAFSIAYMYQF